MFQGHEVEWYNDGAPGRIAQSVTCLAADMCLMTDPGVVSLIPVRSHTFAEIDHEMISTVIILPSADSRRIAVSYKQKNVHEVLVNCLVKLAQEKLWLESIVCTTNLLVGWLSSGVVTKLLHWILYTKMCVIPWSLWICQNTVAIVGAGWEIQDGVQDGRQK